jgi:hypothetical protein
MLALPHGSQLASIASPPPPFLRSANKPSTSANISGRQTLALSPGAQRKEGTVCVPKQNNLPPALKHGIYSNTTILPGEDPAEFKKLAKDIALSLAPASPIETDIVFDIARRIWRKQNLKTFRVAEAARTHMRQQEAYDEKLQTVTPAQIDAAAKRATDKAVRDQEDLGYALVFVADESLGTLDGLTKELQVEAQLNAMIEKCLKRLLLVRGITSMSPSSLRGLPRGSENAPN